MEELEQVDETIENVQPLLEPDMLREIGLSVLADGIQILVTFLALYLIKKSIERIIDFNHRRALRSKRRKPSVTAARLLKNITNYVYYFLLIYSILSILGIPVATLVAGAGIASLAIGIGAQGFVSDIINGFFIIFEKQYKVGDYIHVGKHEGLVREVGIRMTILEDWEHRVYYIPHRNISEVVNESIYPIRYDLNFNVYPDTNFKEFEAVVRQAMVDASPDYLAMLTEEPIYFGATRDNRGRIIYRLRLHSTLDDAADVEGYFTMWISDQLTAAGIQRPLAYGHKEQMSFEERVEEMERVREKFIE